MILNKSQRLYPALALSGLILGWGCSKDSPTNQEVVVEQLVPVSGNNQSAWANTELPAPLVVRTATRSGEPVPGVEVVFEVISDWRGGSSWADSVTSDDEGLASATLLLDHAVGVDTVRVTVAGGDVPPALFTVTATEYWDGEAPFALAPPPPGFGIQMVVRPFYVAPGSELQRNNFVKFPSEVDVDVSRIEFSYATGSHHCNLYRNVDEDLPDGLEDGFSGRFWERPWALVANSQQGRLDLVMPAGVAIRMKARQQLNVQTHYVNAATQETPESYGMIYINFWTANPLLVGAHVGVFVAFNNTIRLPPHQESSFTYEFLFGDTTFDRMSFPMRIFGMTGHFHSRGRTFSVTHFPIAGTGGWGNGEDTTGVEVYNSESWDDPPFETFRPPFMVARTDIMEFTTTYMNNSDDEILFGPRVETQEHANLFVYFYPSSTPDGDYINVSGRPK